ncbi:MAG: tetratricopeptide repeat protein [Candidatus Cryptobacteroides sp.]
MNRNILKISLVVALAFTALAADASDRTAVYRQARNYYEKGLYARARALFSGIADEDPVSGGFAVLCAERMRIPGYETEMERYLATYPYSGLVTEIRYRHALNLFDDGKFNDAALEFSGIRVRDINRSDLAEYTFKNAYSRFKTGDYEEALKGFMKVTRMNANDYKAPASYSAGYILYGREDFNGAIGLFTESAKDPRFADESAFYILECRFMNKDYKYVLENGEALYARIPEERRPHLARIISETYLVSGNTAKAKEYYDRTNISTGNDRKDYFYAGSLLYAVQDYKGAVENYSKMTARTDSIGQIANYQMAYSYIQIKNKVAAMQAFKDAASQENNPDIAEDAYFNYAKLAFDLNNDPSGFKSYIEKYSDRKRGDKIYSYMALAALVNKDYAAAVEAYDKIDELDEDMKRNYMKANYLRAEQLISSGSYRNAVPCLKTAAYYADRNSSLNQLSRYWLAESYYRSDSFAEASDIYRSLYNVSALDGRKEGGLLPYDVAYCYFKTEDYASASRWFDIYLQSGDRTERRDALIRKGDCAFITKAYKDAIPSYESAIREGGVANDLYPYYQAGLAYALTDNVNGEIKLLSEVMKASPSADFWCESVYELGRAYMSSNRNDDASACFSRLVQSGRDTTFQAKALIGLGMISANESQYDEALGYYKQVVARMPSSEYSKDALRAIESIYQTKRSPEEYYAYLKTVADGAVVEGDKESMFFNAAEQIFLAENYQKALVSLQAYMEEYPEGGNVSLAQFYMAECYKNLGKKEQACDWYKKVIDRGEGSFVELSALNFANLSFGMERYEDAYSGYKALRDNARIENNKHTAILGMMNSAYAAKNYQTAVKDAAAVGADLASDKDDKRRAEYVEAKSRLAMSDRSGAFEIFRKLAAETSTPEGAEAAYLVIQDYFDKGDFTSVENKVYAFSDSGSGQTYWLAKAFILLGDSFAERGELKQAKATFESIRDGYTPSGKDDDVLDNVKMRLGKLDTMSE